MNVDGLEAVKFTDANSPMPASSLRLDKSAHSADATVF